MPPRLGPWLAALSGTFLTSSWVGLTPRQVQSFRATRLARRAAATPRWPETFVDETRDGSEGLYFSSKSQLARQLFSDGGFSSLATWRDWYQAPWWLQQGDLMTVLAGTLLREVEPIASQTHVVETSDGGVVALDAFSRSGHTTRGGAPIVLLIPGLGGTSAGGYVKNMASSLLRRGFRVLGLNMRGVGAAKLRTPRFASAHRGSTQDLREAVTYVRKTFGRGDGEQTKVYAMGWSLGGNIVINGLAEQGGKGRPAMSADVRLDGGVALCATHCLTRCAQQYEEHWPMRHIYDPLVLRNLKKMIEPAIPFYRSGPVPAWSDEPETMREVNIDHELLGSAKRIRDIDEALIRRMFGYSSVEEYYYQASSARRLALVEVPLLVVSAADDPMTTSWVPFDTVRNNPQVILAYTRHGGHIAWHDEKNVRRSSWLEDTAGSFLDRLA